MVFFLTLIWSVAHSTQINVQLIVSPKTENLDYYISQIDAISTNAEQKLNEDIQFKLEYTNISQLEDVASLEFSRFTRFVLDLSNDWQIRTQLQQLARDRQFVHLVMDQSTLSNVYRWSLPGLVPPKYVAEKTNFVLNWLNILNAGISVEYTSYSYLFGKSLSEISSLDIEHLIFLSNNYQNILNQVGRTIKPGGLTWQIVYGHGQGGVELFMQAHVDKHIYGKGRGFLLIGDSFPKINNASSEFAILSTGILFIIESGLETANSLEEVSSLRLVNMLILIAQSYKSCGINSTTVSDLSATWLKEQFIAQNYDALETFAPEFSLFNSQNGQLVKVFDIGTDAAVQANVDILYPGNTYTRPQYDTASIEFVYLGGHLNNPIPVDSVAQYIHTGGQIAYSEIDGMESILPNKRFYSNLVEIGGSVLNSDATQPFLESATSLGHAYIGGFSYEFATAFHELEESNPEILKPKFYSNIFHTKFTDPNAYPYLNRISIHNVDVASLIARNLRFFGWKKFIWISQDLPELVDLQEQITQTKLYGGFTAVLTEYYNPSADLDDFDVEYADLIDRIIETNCRIIVALDYDQEKNFKLLEALYKRGYSPGDFIQIYNGQFIDLEGIKEKHPENFEDTMQFYNGALTFSQAKFIGEIGEKLEIAYQEILGEDKPLLAGACFEYDAMYTLAYSLDALLQRGQDYEIPQQLNTEIRHQRLTGCSGYLSFERDTNDRNFPAFYAYQTEYKSGSINQILWAYYNPLELRTIAIYRDFFWADGSISVPTDTFQPDGDCPFPERDRQSTAQGERMAVGICYFIFGISIVIAILIWHRFWNVKILPLEHRVEFSQADLLLTVTIFIEFFQYITTGPDFSGYAYVLSIFANTLAMDIEEVVPLHNGLFWVLVNICVSLTGAIMILYIFNVSKLDSRYPNSQFMRGFRVVSDSILPILDDILFLPIIQIYLEVFVCIETHGDEKYDMFLQQDCYVNCWTGEHLSYAIGTGICLASYIPIAIYMRPTWQESEEDLNVISRPGYLMVKSVFQIMIVALNKTLGRIRPQPFGWVYIIAFVAYFIFLCQEKPFNYNRFCLWKRISVLGCIWITVLTVVHVQIEDESQNLTLLIALIIGWFLLLLSGAIIQRRYSKSLYPSLLYFTPSEEIADMIKFQFRPSDLGDSMRIDLDTHKAIQLYVRQLQARSPSEIHNRLKFADKHYDNYIIHSNSVRKPLENMILQHYNSLTDEVSAVQYAAQQKRRSAMVWSGDDSEFLHSVQQNEENDLFEARKTSEPFGIVPVANDNEYLLAAESDRSYASDYSRNLLSVPKNAESEPLEVRSIARKDGSRNKSVVETAPADTAYRRLLTEELEESKVPKI